MRDKITNECKRCHHKRLQESRKDPSKKEAFVRYQRSSRLKRYYGINTAEFERLKTLQDNKCIICEESPKDGGTRYKAGSKLNIDHCHKTGKVRGLLCHLCNRGIGLFRERADLLKKALEYIEYHT